MTVDAASVQHVWESTEFIAAIVGAVVGGLISFILQIIALVAAKRERDADRNEKQKALAYSLLIKVIQTHTTYNTIKKYFDESFDHAAKQNFDGEPWQIVKPMTHTARYNLYY